MANEFRKKNISVNKTVNGQQAAGYPKDYVMTTSFTWATVTYPALSDTDFANLPNQDYNTRLGAFLLYVQSQEPGFTTSSITNAAYGNDPVECPDSDCLQVNLYWADTFGDEAYEAWSTNASESSHHMTVAYVKASEWDSTTGLPLGTSFYAAGLCDTKLTPTDLDGSAPDPTQVCVNGVIYTVDGSGGITAKA